MMKKLDGRTNLLLGRMYAPSTKPLELMIVDEVSMLDLLVAGPLLRLASSSHTRIVFTGDNRQLSPPGVGQFSIDLAKFHHKLNVVMCTLTTQHRYKGHIASLCDDLRHHLDRKRSPSGKTDAKETVDLSPHVRPLGDVQYLPYDNTLQKDASDSVIVDRYNLLLTDAVASKQSLIMITYQNETLKRLNPKIQAIVNPLPNQKYVTGFASVFRVNDPVRHLVNWYKKAIANDGITMIKVLNFKFSNSQVLKFSISKISNNVSQTNFKIDTMGDERRNWYCRKSDKFENGSQVIAVFVTCECTDVT
jgi:ATP-dependent exoDNAse (exonuclease V) alpha subunit